MANVIKGTKFNDTLDGSTKNDRILTSDGDDVIGSSRGNDFIDGGYGFDLVSYYYETKPIVANLKTGEVTLGGKTDTIRNMEMIIGTDGNDKFYGADRGESWFRGGRGDDTMIGGNAFDWVDYYGTSGSVKVDLIAGRSSGNAGRDIIRNVENMRGTTSDDTLLGDSKDNRIRGMRGDDVIDGRNGEDLADYRHASGRVNVDLEKGIATGADGNDTLRNMEGIRGSDFGDDLIGDTGRNYIEGYGGRDFLTGGLGPDIFYFRTGSGTDTITDFQVLGRAHDTIVLMFPTIDSFKDLRRDHMAQDGDNVRIDAGGGDEIILRYTVLQTLKASHFDIVF